MKRIVYSFVGVAALAFGGVGEAVTRAREAHALAKRRDDRFPRRRLKKKAVAPARKQNGLKPKAKWEPIRL